VRGDAEQLSEAELLDRSVNGLSHRFPEMSARPTLSRGQVWFLANAGALLALGLAVAPLATLVGLNAVGTGLYLLVFLYSVRWLQAMVRKPALITVSDVEARSIPDGELPTYTVLVAAYGEANVISETIHGLEALEYPSDRLQLRLLLEADDRATIEAARATPHRPNLEIIEVPFAMPRTKPKACNYGLQVTSGVLVTIYDAEDRPDPLQLRRAAVAFRRVGPDVACLQAKLHYHNVNENFITRSFGAEYLSWFASLLPALASMGAPVPLGGTSMHVRRDALEAAGAWDPHNVTEDADLGVRLYRLGYRTEVLDSVTLEEANSDFVNWIKQRSRWYKGYLQTWLVHIRNPVRLWRELGTRGFVGFNVVVGATPLLAALNPVFWLLTLLWFTGRPGIVQALFPAWLYYPALASLAGGNFVAVYRTVVAVRVAGRVDLLWAALCSPLYWTMMSIAAIRAIAQLVVKPSHWEKTVHGLGRPRTEMRREVQRA
jgi:cellulose synthase/poly-beta-1,6-N-acetylglucosamine synthase-like glycosyltransferase